MKWISHVLRAWFGGAWVRFFVAWTLFEGGMVRVYSLDFCEIDQLLLKSDSLSIQEARVGPSDLFDCRICPAFLASETWGDKAHSLPLSDFDQQVIQEAAGFRQKAMQFFHTKLRDTGSAPPFVVDQTIRRGPDAKARMHQMTLAAMARGESVIQSPFLMTATRYAAPDFLIKLKTRGPPTDLTQLPCFPRDLQFLEVIPGEASVFGDFFYLPLIIRSGLAELFQDALSDEKSMFERVTFNSDYNVLMLHTLSVLQELQYSKPQWNLPSSGVSALKLATEQLRVDHPQGLFLLRNRHSGSLSIEEDAFTFAYFNMEANLAVDPVLRAKLHRRFDPSFRAAYKAFLSALQVKSRLQVDQTPLHFSSTCKTCPWRDLHVPKMIEQEHVSLIYKIRRETASQISSERSAGGSLNTWRAVANLNPWDAMGRFPKLEGVSHPNTVPELLRIIRQARSLRDQVPIDHFPLEDFPEPLIKVFNSVGLYSYQQFQGLLSNPILRAGLITMLSARFISPEDRSGLAAAKAELSTLKSNLTRRVKRELVPQPSFGHIWTFEVLMDQLFHLGVSPDVMALVAAVAKAEVGLRLSRPEIDAYLDVLKGHIERIQAYPYFEVLELSSVRSEEIKADGALYFDIEGDPRLRLQDDPEMTVEYAWGTRLVNRRSNRAVAEDVKVLKDFSVAGLRMEVWRPFVATVAQNPGVRVYYFSDYEKTVIDRFMRRFGTMEFSNVNLEDRMVDLRRLLSKFYTLPVSSYDLKTLAKWTGFFWRDPSSNAIQSMAWFRNYLESGNEMFLRRILEYNTDDVRATELLHKLLLERLRNGYTERMLAVHGGKWLRGRFLRLGKAYAGRYQSPKEGEP
jgi:hypothetical protein